MKMFRGKMMGLQFLLIVSIVFLPLYVRAKDSSGIRVLKENGQNMQAGVTKLILKAKVIKQCQ